jgi:uncharacterized ferredoxin-like protein
MGIIKEENINKKVLIDLAERMMVAARTAPKARGNDNLEIALIEGDDLKTLSSKMREIGTKFNVSFFIRDSVCVENSTVVVLIGTKIKSIGLQDVCGFCGYKNCDEKDKHPDQPCIYNTNDLGIAIGSAVSLAMDNRVDNRVMFSIGKAAIELGLLGKDVKIALGIPLSATGKSIFFDRK